jgi:tol-pal system protein YbgF
MRPLPMVLPGLALLFFAACASTSDVKTINSQVSDLQDQVAQVKKNASSKEEVQNVNSKVAQQTQTLLKSNADLSVKVAEIDDRMQNTQGSIEQTNYRIERLVQQMTQVQHDIEELRAGMRAAQTAAAPAAATGSGVSATSPVGPTPVPIQGEVNVTAPALPGESPLTSYQAAYRDYQKGNFDLAIGGFRDFLARNPSSDLADNATYWIGESLYSQKKYREAIEQFDLVVSKYPRSDKVPASLLKKGYGYISIGEKSQGIVQLQYVVHEHPSSQEAALARQKLKSLGIDSK